MPLVTARLWLSCCSLVLFRDGYSFGEREATASSEALGGHRSDDHTLDRFIAGCLGFTYCVRPDSVRTAAMLDP